MLTVFCSRVKKLCTVQSWKRVIIIDPWPDPTRNHLTRWPGDPTQPIVNNNNNINTDRLAYFARPWYGWIDVLAKVTSLLHFSYRSPMSDCDMVMLSHAFSFAVFRRWHAQFSCCFWLVAAAMFAPLSVVTDICLPVHSRHQIRMPSMQALILSVVFRSIKDLHANIAVLLLHSVSPIGLVSTQLKFISK